MYRKAHKELWKAIKRGDIKIKPSCSICKSNKFIHNHHSDYRKPLNIIVLCASCHRKLHKAEKNFKKAYLRTERNKYGRFGKEKPISVIKCSNCKNSFEKNNPNQYLCRECSLKLNIGHYSKKELKEKREKDV